MTEAQWQIATDPSAIIRLGYAKSGQPKRLVERIHRRKVRLLACAALRRIWHLLSDKRSRAALEAAERWADRLIDVEAVRKAEAKAAAVIPVAKERWRAASSDRARWQANMSEARFLAACAASSVASADPGGVCETIAWAAAHEAQGIRAKETNTLSGHELIAVRDGRRESERKAQADLRREVFGNPFRSAPAIQDWRTPPVLSLARLVYQERSSPSGFFDSGLLAELCDALERAKCERQDILNHCRGPGPHVRGCWVIDLVRSVD